jgi:ATP-binding cassette subfamily F protein 3
VEKPVSVLSGGERSRLVLCKLLLSPANCLLLDEPTNHLDIRSKDILMGSLRNYGGTMVFVSHDRFFLDGQATKVLEVGSGTAVAYLGNYEDYLARKSTEAVKTGPAAEREPEPGRNAEAAPRERTRRKVNPYKIQELASKIAEVESVIQTHETRIAVLARMLSTEELYRDYTLFRETMDDHDRLRKELEDHMAEWERLQTEMSLLQSQPAFRPEPET